MAKPLTMRFDNDPRQVQCVKAQPYTDALLTTVLGARHIERPRDGETKQERDERLMLDRRFGIDGTAQLSSGMQITFSEKALSASESHYNSVTIEYKQDAETGERGDWYRLCADVYIVGYLNEDGTGYDKWIAVNLPALKLLSSSLVWGTNKNKDGKARASFRHVEANALFECCPCAVIAEHGMLTDANRARLAKLTRAHESVWDHSLDHWVEA